MSSLYGILCGRPIQRKFGTGQSPHYQIEIIDLTTHYRAAVNIYSDSKLASPYLEYYADDNFNHPILSGLLKLDQGYTAVASKPNGLALDYIRDNLFDHTKMVIVPPVASGGGSDLNDDLDKYVSRAMADEQALIYAFGQRWGPEAQKADQYFGFLPGNGIHDIHMNQGNGADFARDDGVWQDGGLMIHLPSEGRWVAIFLAFQSQAWHTDDKTGHRIGSASGTGTGGTESGTQWSRHHHRHYPHHPHAVPVSGTGSPDASQPVPVGTTGEPDFVVRIVGALIQPSTSEAAQPIVTLLNTSPSPIDLAGWSMANRNKDKHPLTGGIPASVPLQITLPANFLPTSEGGIITLLNKDGLKVHGIAYTAEQAQDIGWTITF